MRDEIADRILQEAVHASREGSTDGLFKTASTAPNEAWLSSFLVFGLNDLLQKRHEDDGYFVTFETTVHYLDCVFGRQDDEWLKTGMKFDLVLWKSKFPFALVEVKNSKSMKKWDVEHDANKIGAALLRWRKLINGYFVFSSLSNSLSFSRKSDFGKCFAGTNFNLHWESRSAANQDWHCAIISRSSSDVLAASPSSEAQIPD